MKFGDKSDLKNRCLPLIDIRDILSQIIIMMLRGMRRCFVAAERRNGDLDLCGLGFSRDNDTSIIINNSTDKKSMDDETSRLVNKVQELGDIELAALLCLIAQEHCIIEADEEELENVEQELGLVCMGARTVRCNPNTS